MATQNKTQREIKFRAWGESEESNWEKVMQHSFDVEPDGEIFYGGNAQPDWILMQYTGLLDKDGKEIYEGDIVTTGIFQDINGKQAECRFVVEWKGEYGMWGLANRNAITTFILSEVSMWEVIGNIYENPELLKERNSV